MSEVLEARHTYKSAMSNQSVVWYFKLQTQKKLQLHCMNARNERTQIFRAKADAPV